MLINSLLDTDLYKLTNGYEFILDNISDLCYNKFMNNYTIYTFNDDNNIPFYVGQTNDINRRTTEHWSQINNGNELPKYRKVRQLLSQNKEFKIVPLSANLTKNEADELERFYIKYCNDRRYKLYNLTIGGEGREGYITPQEVKDKISNSKKGISWGKHTKTTKELLSKLKKGIKFSKEHRKKLSVARKNRITKEETRLKRSKTSKGNINITVCKLISPEGKEFLTTKGLTVFCEEHNLTRSNISKVLNGTRKHHKGWKI